MNIGIVMAIVVADGFNHSQGLLCGGGIIQVNQRLAMHLLVQDGEVPANPMHIKCWFRVDLVGRFDNSAHPTSSKFRSAPSAGRSPEGRSLETLAASGMPST